MIFLRLAFKSLWNRKLTNFLIVLSISLSTLLLLSIERARRATEEGFTQAISQTDLIVGARSGPINLILYTVFNMGSATNNISWKTYEDFKKHHAIEWTIPYSLGDGHRGFRVVATNDDFYSHYRYRGNKAVEFAAGDKASGLWDVVLGHAVAKELKYKMGDQIVIAHGVTSGDGIQKHDDKPFSVVGILAATGTALDRSIYMTLEGMEAVHLDWQTGSAPTKDKMIPVSAIKKEDIRVEAITAFFLRTKNRIETLRLQREINEYKDEPLLAIIPGVTLSELWRGLGYAEKTLKLISYLVVFVGLVAMLISLLTGLNERRREMSILRALGASPQNILGLLVFESALLTLSGVVLGLVAHLFGFWILESWLLNEFGLYLVGNAITPMAFSYLILTLIIGMLIGLIPAVQAMRQALKDGLSVRV